MMIKALIALMLFLAGCTSYVPVEVPQAQPAPTKSKYVEELEKFRVDVTEIRRRYPDADKSAEVMLNCDRLGFLRGSDGHRLCVIRGMDRYVDHMTPPLSERYLRRDDELSVRIPKPQPPEPAPVAPQVPHYLTEPIRTPDGGYIYPSYVRPPTGSTN